mmetsp:Transcript_5128/g.7703  ORF Transcript_5128/g.7703 Transcript_5128/m.7703 type:complete len:92 (+) Transcript_5128:239-514(+)
MLRTAVALSKQTGRTIVRDPRKRKLPAVKHASPVSVPPPQDESWNNRSQPLPFEPSPANQQSVGSTLASYALAGAGMAVGFTIVGALFGGF